LNFKSALAVITAGAALAAVNAPSTEASDPERVDLSYTFLSSPDFLNFDLGDVSSAKGYERGNPNSTNASYSAAVNYVINTFKATGAQDYLVAGDLTNGHWGQDKLGTGNFGPTFNETTRVAAVKEAARVYYSKWMSRFKSRSMDIHAAIGDHEIGDNPWKSSTWYPRFKQRNLDVFKDAFTNLIVNRQLNSDSYSHPYGPAAGTAYSTFLTPEVFLVTMDVFQKTSDDVIFRIDDQQLGWLDRQLTKAEDLGVDWIIVQGHNPALGPVRQKSSSGGMMLRGANSAFWKTMARHHVDLYLCGEVHDVTAIHDDASGITQISHGGLFWAGLTSYLTGTVSSDGATMDLRVNRFDFTAERPAPSSPSNDPTKRLWQTWMPSMVPIGVTFSNPHETGTMTITKTGKVLERSGELDVYNP
jgi:hypothetical protein